MDVLSPAQWQDVSTVAVIIVLSLLLVLSLIRGWVVFGPHHRELIRLKDETLRHEREACAAKDRTIATQAETIQKQTVSSEVSTHLLEALRDLTGAVGGDEP